MAGSSPAKEQSWNGGAFVMTGELLLELLSEEIPARMQRRASDDLTGLIRDKLAAADVPASSVAGYVTPRRLVVIAEGIPERQPDRNEERRGPRVGAPEQAIAGFLRSAGLSSIDQCEVRDEFYFAAIKRPGRATSEVLPELILAAMTALPWPKSMRYPASSLRWVRPLNSVVCLFDGEVLNLPLGEVPVGRATRGHRFLAPDEIEIAGAADYREKLAKAHVVLDRNERRDIIAQGLDRLAKTVGLTVKPDEALLEEVTGLVEYPVALMGGIDADFVRPLPDGLPPEVLATAMRTHQKYFSCLNSDGTPAPRFLFVANNVTPDGGKTIAAGNERVLRARLADARFFWDQDRKVRLEDRVEALKQRIYHEKLGSVYDKVERMEKLAEHLADYVPGADKALCRRAARLAKADLSTGMVGEFPELQGIMGRYYALNDGEAPRVADAIADHYKPLGPNDTCPSAPESIVLALADKVDALAAFFAIGELPTGSRDPFALRRSALGMIRLILEHGLSLSLGQIFSLAVLYTARQRPEPHPEQGSVKDLILEFVSDRLKVHLREQNVRHDLVAAVFALKEDDLVRLLGRVRALQDFLETDDGASLLVAYRRAANIVAIEERRDGIKFDDRDDITLMTQAEERTLARALASFGGKAGEFVLRRKFEDAMAALSPLRQPVDEFFERVTVNVEEKELRENRLRLLARIRATMNQVADFSQIEG
jgi:glycyl-tRNA synthetase beta chain